MDNNQSGDNSINSTKPQNDPGNQNAPTETPDQDVYQAPNQPASPGYTSDIYSAELTPEGFTPETNPPEALGNQPPSPPPVYPEAGGTPPPPFEEGGRGKIIAIAAGILILLVLIFFGLKLFGNKGAGTAKNVTLNYWGIWEDTPTIQPLIDEYQKSHPNIKIVYTKQSSTQYRERLQAALGRGEGPDIFRFHNTWTPMFANDLSPIPTSVYSAADFEKTFYPVAKSDLAIGSNYYGLPLEIDGLVLLYNDDILKAANVTVPGNWEDFRNTAAKLTVKDSSGQIQTAGVALGSADNIAHFSDILGLMFLQNGTNLKDPQGPCSDPSTTTCATDTLIFYRKFADLPNNNWDDNQDNSIVSFASGKVAMIFAPTWEILTIKQINPNLNFKVTKVPQLPGVTLNWATYWVEGVSKRSNNQLTAWDFLKFLSSKESLTKLYSEEAKTRAFGEPYSRVDLGPTLSNDPYLGPLIAETPTMKSFPLASSTYDNGINDEMIKYLLDAVNSLKTGGNPGSALGTASQGFKQVLTKYGVLASQPTASQ